MDCPRCGLINPPDAARCDCGYDFIEGIVRDSYLDTEQLAHTEGQRRRRVAPADAAGGIDCGLDIGDAADPSEVWDNCDLPGCPPDCDSTH